MNFLAVIHEEAGKRGLRFLVIGGLAVNHYGFQRDTHDLDVFISQSDKAGWLDLLASLGYTIDQDGGPFIQLSPPQQNAWPVDLMLVQPKTFESMYLNGLKADFYGTSSKVPRLEDLLALKVHALKHAGLGRFLKDFLDVENLMIINKIDVKSENIRQLFVKYGTPDLYEKISLSLASK